ncbi:MAG: succinate dehydrogenase assembly factor 2 [Betaproteobacteria bacterium]
MSTELSVERLNRIRWRSRRGMLENDLMLTRFLDARGDEVTEAEVAMLDCLLDLSDNELWDLIAGRREPQDATVMPLLKQLRSLSFASDLPLNSVPAGSSRQ